MSEIEKKAEAYAEGQLTSPDSPEWPKLPGFRDNLKDELSAAFAAGAAAVIELIRERMPELYKGDGYGKNGQEYCQDVMNLLNSLR